MPDRSTNVAVTGHRVTVIFLGVLLLLATAMAYVITQTFLRPFAFAIILAVVFYPLHEQVLRLTKQRASWASLISTLALLFVFGFPVVIILLKAANEALLAAEFLARRSAEQGGLTSFVTSLAARPMSFVSRWVDLTKYDLHTIIRTNIEKSSGWMLSMGAGFLGNFARFIGSFFVTLVIAFFLFRDGKQWAYRAATLTPLSPAQVNRLYRNVADTIVANVYGIVSVGVAQGLLTGIALRIVGIPSALLLGLAASFASIIPVVGAAIIWAPAGIYLIVTGSTGKGIFVLLFCLLVVSSVDNFIRPWVVSGKVELHPLVLLFFILGGVEVFGFLGIFIGPVVASVLAALFDMFREELGEKEEVATAAAHP